MKRTAAVIMAVTFALSTPMIVSAAEHGTKNMEMDHGEVKTIHTQTVDGVKATFILIDLKARMKGMEVPAGMKDTHHLMIMFSDAKTGKMLKDGEVKVKIAGPDKTEQIKTMMAMSGGFGSDVNLSVKGRYGIMTKFLLKGSKVRSSKFWYKVK